MLGKQDKKVVTKWMLLSADCEEFSERRTLFCLSLVVKLYFSFSFFSVKEKEKIPKERENKWLLTMP